MATEKQSKKRKAVVPDDEVEKVKKVKQLAADVLPKKRKATEDADPTASKKTKTPKSTSKESKSKSSKMPTTVSEGVSIQDDVEAPIKKPKSSKAVVDAGKKLKEMQDADGLEHEAPRKRKAKQSTKTLLESENENEVTPENSEDEEVDDQTDALLKGFESDDEDDNDPAEGGYEAGQEIPKIDKKARKQAKAAEKAAMSDRPGVVYVGRIPHGFYEQEMRQYFSQFGDISNLRLSRNRKTGRSKHFAFVEFKSAEVAEIVSKTMDNYLLFGHILKCKVVAPEQVHENLWEGANRRFKKVPWNKLEGRKLAKGSNVADWDKRIEKEQARRAEKKEAMKAIGYEFESPKLKSAKDVLKSNRQALIEADTVKEDEEVPKAIEDIKTAGEDEPILEGDGPSKKKRKGRKSSDKVNGAEAAEIPPIANGAPIDEVVKSDSAKKSKKKRKEKAI